MQKKNPREIAQLFSAGTFLEVEEYLSENIEWNIYEEKNTLSGKKSVVAFCKNISAYFQSVTTKFETFGMLEDGNKIAIYGRGEFLRGTKTVNVVYSCDVYEFSEAGKIDKIFSYCNSSKPG